MQVTAQMVKELRDQTGAPMMDCKAALGEAEGDLERAVDYLRQKGVASAAKKAGRETAEGLVRSYIHAGGKIGVLLEVNCETDLVTSPTNFQEGVRDIAMHVAASSPMCIDESGVAAEELERERRILTEQAEASGKLADIVEKMVHGRINKYLKEITLLGQPFVKDPDISIGKLLESAGASVTSFVRFEVGEGIEKKQENLADEVMKQISDAKKGDDRPE